MDAWSDGRLGWCKPRVLVRMRLIDALTLIWRTARVRVVEVVLRRRHVPDGVDPGPVGVVGPRDESSVASSPVWTSPRQQVAYECVG